MEITSRKSISEKLNVFCPMCKDTEYIEVTEWANGEGYDIEISEEKRISLHWDELDAINYLVNHLRYYGDNDQGTQTSQKNFNP